MYTLWANNLSAEAVQHQHRDRLQADGEARCLTQCALRWSRVHMYTHSYPYVCVFIGGVHPTFRAPAAPELPADQPEDTPLEVVVSLSALTRTVPASFLAFLPILERFLRVSSRCHHRVVDGVKKKIQTSPGSSGMTRGRETRLHLH